MCGMNIRQINCYRSLSCTLGCHSHSVITYPLPLKCQPDSLLTSGLNLELFFRLELFHCSSEEGSQNEICTWECYLDYRSWLFTTILDLADWWVGDILAGVGRIEGT